MGSRQNPTCSMLHHFAVSFLILLVLSSSQPRFFIAEGRPIDKTIGNSEIGSRPPRCDGKCNTCGHCEAIQVPANPQNREGHKNYFATISTVSYGGRGGEDYPNYKPMCWKCKCGDLIFNP
ncbi:hypothetical protein ACH5RR_013931 [Cinchona calisaya]|uniref:Epidermal patterning factor-like protein n=1 Tax=Cinchona calisaya TaxID=153742 RepID=A0ABD3A2V9_9GENT